MISRELVKKVLLLLLITLIMNILLFFRAGAVGDPNSFIQFHKCYLYCHNNIFENALYHRWRKRSTTHLFKKLSNCWTTNVVHSYAKIISFDSSVRKFQRHILHWCCYHLFHLICSHFLDHFLLQNPSQERYRFYQPTRIHQYYGKSNKR